MLAPHGALVIEANLAIIPTSQTTAICYFCLLCVNRSLMLNTFNSIDYKSVL